MATNNPNDAAFASGFDVPPEISYPEALAEQFDQHIAEAATEFDSVADGVLQFVDDELRTPRIELTQIQNRIGDTIDNATNKLASEISLITSGIIETTTPELRRLVPPIIELLSQCPNVISPAELGNIFLDDGTINPAFVGNLEQLAAICQQQIGPGGEPLPPIQPGPAPVPGPAPGPVPGPIPVPGPGPQPNGGCRGLMIASGSGFTVHNLPGSNNIYLLCGDVSNWCRFPRPGEQPYGVVPGPNPFSPGDMVTVGPAPGISWGQFLDSLDHVAVATRVAGNAIEYDWLYSREKSNACDSIEPGPGPYPGPEPGPKPGLYYYNCDTGELKAVEPGAKPGPGKWVVIHNYNPDDPEATDLRSYCPPETEVCPPGSTDPLCVPPPVPEPEPGPAGSDCDIPVATWISSDDLGKWRDLIAEIDGGSTGLAIGGLISSLLGSGGAAAIPVKLWSFFTLQAITWFKTFLRSNCPDNEQIVDHVFSRAVFGFLGKFAPGAFDETIGRLNQLIGVQCPWEMPSVEQAHSAFLTNQIDAETWKCWVEANAVDSKYQRKVVHGQRSRLDINSVIAAYRRGYITDAEMIERGRGLGYLDPQEVRFLNGLTEQIPTMSDIIQFMVRDADDPAIVQQFGLDAEFDNKYGGQLKEWAKWQGIDEDVARYAWRSHWSIPSPTQLFEIYHRVGRNPDGSEIPAVRKDVENALVQQDILPFWIPKLLATSETLPTRVDIRRGYRVGVFTKADVKELYVRQGYSTKSADALTKFTELENKRSVQSSPFVKAYARGDVNEAELRDVLNDEGADAVAVDSAVKRAKLLLAIDRKKRCLSAVKRKVMIGEVDRNQAFNEAASITNDNNQALTLVDAWFCERDSKSKTATASQLCQFFTDGLIDSAEFFRRLINIGYKQQVATELVQRCQLNLNRKLAKMESARLAKLEAQAKKDEAARTKAEKDRTKAAADTEKARQKAAESREARQKGVLEAAKLLAPKAALPVEELYRQLKARVNVFIRNGLASANKIVSDGKIVAGSVDVFTVEDWEAALLDVLTEGQPD